MTRTINRHECSLCGTNLEQAPFAMDHACIAYGDGAVILRSYVAVEDVVWLLGDYIASGSEQPADVWIEGKLKACRVCGGEPLADTDGPDGEPMERVCGACTEAPAPALPGFQAGAPDA